MSINSISDSPYTVRYSIPVHLPLAPSGIPSFQVTSDEHCLPELYRHARLLKFSKISDEVDSGNYRSKQRAQSLIKMVGGKSCSSTANKSY
jgi:hypothetical protein